MEEKQQRNTRQRALVLAAVRARTDHPNADQIYIDVREKDSRISRGTVYRNLELLSENGEIRHVRVPGADRYDLRTADHCHMLCSVCGRVVDAPIAYDARDDAGLSAATGWEISRHMTVYVGVCADCAAQLSAIRR